MIMINPKEAQQLILDNTNSLESAIITVEDTLGFILAENIKAPISLPPFRQSAMDGYAVAIDENFAENDSLTIVGEIKAGANTIPEIKSNEAVRIFTGAPVPESANTVVMQEHTEVDGNKLSFTQKVKLFANIRDVGSAIKKDVLALVKGQVINPGAIGLLKSLGLEKLNVIKKPIISVIATGDELIESGNPLGVGQIYESNSDTIIAALKQSQFNDCKGQKVKDDFEQTKKSIASALEQSDVVILSGGISVGDYDFVGVALEKLGVETIFYKINQKPGKPMFFGKKDDKLVFALPGNPAAALSCMYEYVIPALKKMSGFTNVLLSSMELKSTNDFSSKAKRNQFLKAKVNENGVEILDGQNSHVLASFAEANALVYLSEEKGNVKKGDFVETHLLPS